MLGREMENGTVGRPGGSDACGKTVLAACALDVHMDGRADGDAVLARRFPGTFVEIVVPRA